MKKKMEIIKLNKLVEMIQATDGKIFRVTFVKRGTGEFRDMTARFGVTSHLKGGALKFNPKDKKLLIVFDMEKNDYRAINIDGIISAHIDDIEYITGETITSLKRLKKEGKK